MFYANCAHLWIRRDNLCVHNCFFSLGISATNRGEHFWDYLNSFGGNSFNQMGQGVSTWSWNSHQNGGFHLGGDFRGNRGTWGGMTSVRGMLRLGCCIASVFWREEQEKSEALYRDFH
ncbi:hypothetical protein AVEN_90131-1 [Araneus ventricosus]|uniref:Uncharacterized protein n=1 Tax=Araneus ventricosus TaxID=182803 RepID=A0A4Y2R066_ARAVE|nr:hypothetical protein AVEN_90131-1 [Araneus ventricosus]